MDENKNTGPQPEQQELLQTIALGEEIQPDEAAMAAAGLTHPENAETDRIIEEVRDMTQTDSVPLFRDQEYTDAFGEGEDLERIFSDEPYEAPQEEIPEYTDGGEPEEDEPEQPQRKGRPRRKKGAGLLGIPHILSTIVWLAVVVMLGVSLGRVAWVCVADVMAFGRDEMEIQVTIDESDTIDDIATKLRQSGLIRYPELFKAYALLSDAREDISAGTFTLNTIYDYHALVNCMTTYSSTREVTTVMIPEGYTCERIFNLLEEKGVCKAEELAKYAAEGELDEYWFLEGVERGTANCLEGFLFPDTYDFYIDDNPKRVLEKLLDTFDYRFSEDMEAAIETLNTRLADMMRSHGYGEDYIAANRFGIYEIVTVASLIEKETANSSESYTVASVIYNRLTNQAAWPFLNIDAALLYALGHKEALSAEDLKADTPYNTYLYKGLIPGPIANPGLNSLNAALNPEDTNYHYYVLNPETGTHIFSETSQEHINAGG